MRSGRLIKFALIVWFFMGLVATVGQAQTRFGDDDLEGAYAFSFNAGPNGGVFATGLLVADGSGGFTGVLRAAGVQGNAFDPEQSISGSYAVQPDGTGTALLQLTPPLRDKSGQVQLKLVLVSGDEFFFNAFEPASPSGSGIFLGGIAKRQRPVEQDPEVELRLERLEALSCEVVRLLNTPQGLRASECCEEPVAFPEGKDAPTCTGNVVIPAPVRDPLQLQAPPRPQR